MKCLRLYFCVLLCCVLSLGVFSVGVSAADTTENTGKYKIHQMWQFPYGVWRGEFDFFPNDGTVQKKEVMKEYVNAIPSGTSYTSFEISNVDSDILFKAGRKVSVGFNNIYYSILYEDWYNGELMQQQYITEPTNVYARVKYVDNSTKEFPCEYVVRTAKTINISFTFTPEKDVQSIQYFTSISDIDKIVHNGTSFPDHTFTLTKYFGEFIGDDKFQFAFEVSSEEAGLLAGIIEWLKGIKEGITNLFNSIAELPQKIWSFIENGLKSLFVPSEEFLVTFKSDMDKLLSEKLGAVYQVTSLLTTGWDRITDNDKQNTIHIPETTIPLPNNNSFSFGGYEVQIVPAGFEFIVNTLKTVLGIVCTILCVNVLRKKYDEVMGVEQ